MKLFNSSIFWPIILGIVAGLVTFVALQMGFGNAGAADIGAWQLFASAAGAFGVAVFVLALSAMFLILRTMVQRNLRR